MRTSLAVVACAAAVGLCACATYLDDLNRAERYYAANEHERALALFRTLEADTDSLSYVDRARYAYLRGMNDYRLGKQFRADARHWLSVAKAMEQEKPGSLQEPAIERLNEALRDLNQDVYGIGVYADGSKDEGAEGDRDDDERSTSDSE